MSHQENEKDDSLSPIDETSSPMNSPIGAPNCDYNQENRSNINELSYKPASDSDTHNQSSSDDENKNSFSSSHIQSSQSSSEAYSQPATLPGLSISSSSPQSQKRPMNAFLIFCKRHRSVVKQKYPHLENRSITKILGEWWAGLDSEEKQKYTELARTYKEAFMRANPHFKWYKTDIRTPPVFQPPSPPHSHSSQTSLTSSEKSNHFSPSCGQSQSQSSNSTPKPPKKRYLENLEIGEFKGLSGGKGALPSTSQSTSNAATLNIGGPPVLDIDTMNRVIENALRDGPVANSQLYRTFEETNKETLNCKSKESSSSSKIQKEENQTINNDTIKLNSSQSSSSLDLVNSLPSNLNINNNNNNSNNININSNTSNIITTQQSSTASLEDKPLNLSSSKVLHTSNQQIIDHFIDKWLGSSPTGNPLPPEMLNMPSNASSSSSSSSSSTAFSSTNHSSLAKQNRKERSCKGKRYLEMLSEGKLAKRIKNNTIQTTAEDMNSMKDNNSSSLGNSGSSNSSENNSNVNDGTSLQSGGTGIVKTLNNTSGSKWVSGGFDLEEHIAALPQLGDTHLMNALNSKANKSINGAKNGNEADNKSLSNNISINSNSNSNRSSSGSSSSNTTTTTTTITNNNNNSNSSSNNTNTELTHLVSLASNNKTGCLKENSSGEQNHEEEAEEYDNVENIENNNFKNIKQKESNLIMDTHKSSDTNVDRNNCENSDNDIKEEKEDKLMNYNESKCSSNDANEVKSQGRDVYIHTSQGIECDGLAALAEVALQQAHCNAISSSSS